MPRTTREWAKRKLSEAINNIDWAGAHMAEVIERYEEQHPEVSDPLISICTLLAEAQNAIKQTRKSF